MGDRQRFIVANLAQYGVVDEVDSLDMPPNAFTLVQNMAYYKGRIGQAARFGSFSTANPIFTGTTYRTCALWELYGGGTLKIKAGAFAEYENAAGTMYEIPCWLGMYATGETGVFTGNSLDGNWSTATFPRAPYKWLTTDDKVYTAALATPELGKEFTDMGGWKFTVSGVTTWPTAGAVYRDGSSQDYTVGYSDSSGGFVYAYGSTTPPASGTLTKQSGTGDASITYSARTDVVTLKTYADWTDSSTAILQADTTNPAGYPTADCAYNSTLTEGLAFNSGAIAAITNQFFTIRKIKLMGEGANASLIVRDNTTKRGYALQVEQTATPGTCWTFRVNRNNWATPPAAGDVYTRPNGTEFTIVGHAVTATGLLVIYTEGTGDPALSLITENAISRKAGYSGGQASYWVQNTALTTGPFTVTIRLWDGYFDSSDSAVGVNAAVVWEKTEIYDWGYSTYNDVYYEDLWMWWRDNFVTFGYGPNSIGCISVNTSAIPETPRVGFALKNAYIATATSGKYCIYSIDVATNKTGPYAITSVNATQVRLTTYPADGDYLMWACKYGSRSKIVCGSDYILFRGSPATIWRGGMTEEVPLTNPKYEANFAYYANDIAIFKGRVFLGGTNKMIHKYDSNLGFYSWVNGLSSLTSVKWSAPYNTEVWEDCYPSGTTGDQYYLTGHIDFAETNGRVNAIGQLRDVLVVYKSDAIAMLSPTGIALDPFSVDYMSWDVGVNDPGAVGISPLTHYFHSGNKFWRVEVGEVSPIKLKANYGWSDRFWMLPSENTVLFGLGDSAYPTIGYNEKYDTLYYADIPLVHLTTGKKYIYGINAAGKYVYVEDVPRAANTSIARTSASLDSFVMVGPHWSFGDLVNTKTIYTIDVYARDVSGSTGYSSASLNVKLMVDSTTDAAYTTLTGEKKGSTSIGYYTGVYPEKGEWRFRLDRVATGILFQLAVQLHSSNPLLEITRIEIDYEATGPSKKA